MMTDPNNKSRKQNPYSVRWISGAYHPGGRKMGFGSRNLFSAAPPTPGDAGCICWAFSTVIYIRLLLCPGVLFPLIEHPLPPSFPSPSIYRTHLLIPSPSLIRGGVIEYCNKHSSNRLKMIFLIVKYVTNKIRTLTHAKNILLGTTCVS